LKFQVGDIGIEPMAPRVKRVVYRSVLYYELLDRTSVRMIVAHVRGLLLILPLSSNRAA
jgi:hypothetical protein